MGLFTKKCAICKVELPERRRYKGVCDKCGTLNMMYSKQLTETTDIVKNSSKAETRYYRSLFGLERTDDYMPFWKKKVGPYPDGRSYEEIRAFFFESAKQAAYTIQEENDKRKYSKKVGIPTIESYQELATKEWHDGLCKSCKESKPLNDKGYCFACITRATVIKPSDIEAYIAECGGQSVLPENELARAAFYLKMEKSK